MKNWRSLSRQFFIALTIFLASPRRFEDLVPSIHISGKRFRKTALESVILCCYLAKILKGEQAIPYLMDSLFIFILVTAGNRRLCAVYFVIYLQRSTHLYT